MEQNKTLVEQNTESVHTKLIHKGKKGYENTTSQWQTN